MDPRYQCVAVGPVWSWRLLGSNHRELARSASRFTSLAETAADAQDVAAQARTATMDITLGPDSAWHWVMTIDGADRASSAVGYARRLECSRAVDRFRESAPTALVSPVPLVHRRLGDRARGSPAESAHDDCSLLPGDPGPR